jgi:hypothetical protein
MDAIQADRSQAMGIQAGAQEEGRMITHVVLFRPKAALSEDDRRALLHALERALSGIPSIKRTTIGKRVLLNRPGYETQMTEHYEYSAILEFESEADLRAYLDHPAHADLGRLLFTSADAVLAYDYACMRLNEL